MSTVMWLPQGMAAAAAAAAAGAGGGATGYPGATTMATNPAAAMHPGMVGNSHAL